MLPLQPRTAERAYEPGVDDHVKQNQLVEDLAEVRWAAGNLHMR